jgi:hypothetical protein
MRPRATNVMAATALASYVGLALLAAWVERIATAQPQGQGGLTEVSTIRPEHHHKALGLILQNRPLRLYNLRPSGLVGASTYLQ